MPLLPEELAVESDDYDLKLNRWIMGDIYIYIKEHLDHPLNNRKCTYLDNFRNAQPWCFKAARWGYRTRRPNENKQIEERCEQTLKARPEGNNSK